MNKKLLFIPLSLSGMLLTSVSFNVSLKEASADNVINFDTSVIEALSHKDNELVNFVNDDIASYWDGDASDIDKLLSLYESNTEMTSFFDNSDNHEYVRELYEKWDDFKPVNNILKWKSNISASSYDIVISLTPDLTSAVYEEKGLTKPEYKMDNPFSNTHYYWQITAHKDNEIIKSQIFDFRSADYKRTIDIPSISNTRDVGGFNSKYGEMKEGYIYRSGRLDDIDESYLASLNKLNIQTDLDLRNVGEGSNNPAHLSNYYLKTLKSYFTDLTEENRKATVEAVRMFSNPDNYPVIFHCAIGRDRTGTLAILLQALCGASKEYIIHDYYTSMWSVTGAYQKSVKELNYGVLNETLEALEKLGNDINSGAENFLKIREDLITHEQVGLTDEEINMIRDIWSGKVETRFVPKPFKASENYEGKAYVNIKAIGHKNISMMVEKGTKISAPYELNNSLLWFSNNEKFDFSSPINEDKYIYADYGNKYVITIHFASNIRPDEILMLGNGENVPFDKYSVDGFTMLIITDIGEVITELRVSKDTYINIIYIRK